MTETVVGNYRILSELGQGACGRVYLAKHSVLEKRTVALKLMHTIPLHEHEEKNLFLQESHMLEVLRHPYILPIIDAGVNEGLPYIVTEYAPNGSLRQLLQQHGKQPLEQEEALTILSQIGAALQFAHEQQVVHRDLKPENILFNTQGEALLADFGLAVTLASMSMHVTTEAGTPAYMAPEQFQGVASREGDQYALGCIAYELFTGQRLFSAPNIAAMMYNHLHEEPIPPSQHNPTLAPHIEEAILKALAKQRHDRHSDIPAFLAALSAPSSSSDALPTRIQMTSTRSKRTKTLSSLPTLLATDTSGMETRLMTQEAFSPLQTKVLTVINEEKTQFPQPIAKHVRGKTNRPIYKRRWLFVALACVIALAALITPFLSQVKTPGTKAIFAVAPPLLKTTPVVKPTHSSGGVVHSTATPHSTTNPSTQATATTVSATATTVSATATAIPKTTATSTNTPGATPTSVATTASNQLTLAVSPGSYSANSNCTWQTSEMSGQHGGGTWSCAASLQNAAQKSLSWTATSSGMNTNSSSISFAQTRGVLAAGQSATVHFQVNIFNGGSCTSDMQNADVIFSGPINTVTAPWTCTNPTYTVSPLNITTKSCQLSSGQWQCTVTVTINAQGEVLLGSSSSNSTVTVSPSFTILNLPGYANGSTQLSVSVPATSCPGTMNITYSGGNSGNVSGSLTC